MDSSSNSSGSVGCEDIPCQGHRGDGVVTMDELQDVIGEGGVSNTAAEVIEILKGLTTTESAQCGLEDLPCHLSARFGRCRHSSITECAADIRKCLYAKVVLSDSVARGSASRGGMNAM